MAAGSKLYNRIAPGVINRLKENLYDPQNDFRKVNLNKEKQKVYFVDEDNQIPLDS